MSQFSIAVVILNWNGKDDTLDCLRSVQGRKDTQARVIVVDNGSTDDSVGAVRKEFPNVTIIETGANLGYASGNNTGITWALDQGADYVMVLNNDVVLASDCLAFLVEDLEGHPGAAAAGPKSYYYDNPERIYFAGGRISFTGHTDHIGVGELDNPCYSSACDVQWLTGCAILFSSRALRKVGLFESRYYLLFEDSDWSLRAARAGYQLRFVPEAKLWHRVSSTFGRTETPFYLYYYARNSLLWTERNFPIYRKPLLYFFAIRRAFSYAMSWSNDLQSDGRRRMRFAFSKGISDYMLRRFGKRDYPELGG